MNTIDEVVSLYEQGIVAKLEFFLRAASLVTPENVRSIMPAVPKQLLPEFKEWAFMVPERGGITIGGGKGVPKEALRAVREWFTSR